MASSVSRGLHFLLVEEGGQYHNSMEIPRPYPDVSRNCFHIFFCLTLSMMGGYIPVTDQPALGWGAGMKALS